jgi:hypothetical protein
VLAMTKNQVLDEPGNYKNLEVKGFKSAGNERGDKIRQPRMLKEVLASSFYTDIETSLFCHFIS